MQLQEIIFNAGIIGAGGAGFPTYKKFTGQIEMLIINAVECEPLLCSDRYVMRNHADEVIEALMLLKQEMGIPRVVIGTKAKYKPEIEALKKAIAKKKADIELYESESVYPAGDELVLIYEITGKAVAPGSLPLSLGIVVSNVTTIFNIYDALQGKPVVSKFITVNGEVRKPSIVEAPIGTSVYDCIAAAGGTSLEDYFVIVGGPMMGTKYDMDQIKEVYVNKATGGIIVLPKDHFIWSFDSQSIERMVNQVRSVCIQCSYCTDYCPRYLIGHRLNPHKIMRALGTQTNLKDLNEALLCTECGICELFACPMGLSPRKVNAYVKKQIREGGGTLVDKNLYTAQIDLREHRKISQERLIHRLDLGEYPRNVEELTRIEPHKVNISLAQGIGRAASPVVKAGDSVLKGQCIAEIDFGQIGNRVHASLSGTVKSIDKGIEIVAREGMDI